MKTTAIMGILMCVLLTMTAGLAALDTDSVDVRQDPRNSGTRTVIIRSWEDLHNVRDDPSGDYVLGTSLGPADTGYDTYAGPLANAGEGWDPIGGAAVAMDVFDGSLDGHGHTITGLVVYRPDELEVGLFGVISHATITDLGLVDVDITGHMLVGGITGSALSGTTISSCYVSGSVYAMNDMAGGIAGHSGGTIENCYSSADVTGESGIGGLVGVNAWAVTNCYSIGRVEGVDPDYTGGLLGWVEGGAVEASFWDTTRSGQAASAAGIGHATARLKEIATYTGWDIEATAVADPTDGYPFLSWQIPGSSPTWYIYDEDAEEVTPDPEDEEDPDVVIEPDEEPDPVTGACGVPIWLILLLAVAALIIMRGRRR